MRRTLGKLVAVLAVSAISVLSASARAAPPDISIFYWVDVEGAVHVTDRLQDVPEPFYSMYKARLKKLAEDRERQQASQDGGGGQQPAAEGQAAQHEPTRSQRPSTRSSSRGSQSFISKEIAKRDRWRALVARWRRELTRATEELHKLEQEINQVQMNPIIRHIPASKARVAELEPRREQARRRVLDARKMLLEVIPAQARKEQVPPLWLQ